MRDVAEKVSTQVTEKLILSEWRSALERASGDKRQIDRNTDMVAGLMDRVSSLETAIRERSEADLRYREEVLKRWAELESRLHVAEKELGGLQITSVNWEKSNVELVDLKNTTMNNADDLHEIRASIERGKLRWWEVFLQMVSPVATVILTVLLILLGIHKI